MIGMVTVDEKSIRRGCMPPSPKSEGLRGKGATQPLMSIGRILFGVSMIVLGIMGVTYTDFVMEWTAAPANIPARALWAYAHGGVLIVAGLGVLSERTLRLASLALGTVWLAWTVLYVPRVIAHWPATLGGPFKDLALASGAFLLAAVSDFQTTRRPIAAIACNKEELPSSCAKLSIDRKAVVIYHGAPSSGVAKGFDVCTFRQKESLSNHHCSSLY